MRTPNRSSHLFVLGLGALAGSLLALAACSDSLHLDPAPVPPGGTGGGGGGPGQGGGGGGAITCSSSSDCPYPVSICDTIRRECVQCVEHSDCSFQPGTVCSEGSCVCAGQADGEQFCPEVGVVGQPGHQPAGCVNVQTSTNNCGACGVACFGACAMGQCADPWEKTAEVGAPSPRYLHVAVWAGDRMIVWGGEGGGLLNTGGVYDPATRTWTATSLVNAPSPRRRPTAVWTGTDMIVWGGEGSGGALLNDGAMFDPATNSWRALPQPGFAFAGRIYHTAIWTGTDMIIWGGTSNPADPVQTLGDGARFVPGTGVWSQTNAVPLVRKLHSAVWGSVGGTDKMIVYGGSDGTAYADNVLTYDPVANAWENLGPAGSATPRAEHTAVWTGTQMIIWGGNNGSPLADGWRFEGGAWNPLGAPEPSPRYGHTAVWADGNMIVWGGSNGTNLGSGGIYNGTSWNLEMPTAPTPRSYHTAVVTSDNRMILWGGATPSGVTNTGAVFNPAAAP